MMHVSFQDMQIPIAIIGLKLVIELRDAHPFREDIVIFLYDKVAPHTSCDVDKLLVIYQVQLG